MLIIHYNVNHRWMLVAFYFCNIFDSHFPLLSTMKPTKVFTLSCTTQSRANEIEFDTRYNAHLNDGFVFTNFYFLSGQGCHVTINARSEDDLDYDALLDKVKSSSGANYSIHKEKAKPAEQIKPVVKLSFEFLLTVSVPLIF